MCFHGKNKLFYSIYNNVCFNNYKEKNFAFNLITFIVGAAPFISGAKNMLIVGAALFMNGRSNYELIVGAAPFINGAS